MGTCCSKSSNSTDAFSQPGRVLGSAPSPEANPRASVPPKIDSSRRTTGNGRTLGGAKPSGGNDPKSAAAMAAEERAARQAAAAAKGKLTSRLAAMKAQTRNEVLNEASRTERATRDVDAAEEVRRWD
ncbi:hypothetical protein AJ80_03423 [Polytolypa hystricis UAMH7299]|uniref:Uncharacterized protein n=1 Tax=Polytolypa hystricis (strain UAMH7299) TaxID=1447883 RepID=A0A2B7YGX9_POLH7|nr:hypothetical protein AJ80_03423 [Polytolypa hystricis UAMH7299]